MGDFFCPILKSSFLFFLEMNNLNHIIMNYTIYLLIIAIASVAIALIREVHKNRRIDKLKGLPNSKIESIGNYEEKSKSKDSIFNLRKKLNNK